MRKPIILGALVAAMLVGAGLAVLFVGRRQPPPVEVAQPVQPAPQGRPEYDVSPMFKRALPCGDPVLTMSIGGGPVRYYCTRGHSFIERDGMLVPTSDTLGGTFPNEPR